MPNVKTAELYADCLMVVYAGFNRELAVVVALFTPIDIAPDPVTY